MERDKMKLKYILYTLLAVVFTFVVHEFSHWVTGKFLGYDMTMTLNTAYPNSEYKFQWHYTLISAVGPITTLIQGFIVYLLLKGNENKNLYPFLFASFYTVLIAGVINIFNPNDLGRISRTFHLGLFTIPIIFTLIHFYMVYKTSVREKYSMKFNLWTLFWTMLFSSIWILSNQQFKIILI